MTLDTPKSWLMGDKSFLVAKLARVAIGFTLGYWLQLYLIRQYPGEINAWLQVSLRTIDLNTILTTGFGVISLSSGVKATQFIARNSREYISSLAIRLLLFSLIVPTLYVTNQSRLKDLLGPLTCWVVSLLGASVLSGDANNFAYANHLDSSYEKSQLIGQVFGYGLLAWILFRHHPAPTAACALAFCLTAIPRSLIDFCFLLSTYSRLLRRKRTWRLVTNRVTKGFLVSKGLMVSLLGAVAYFNWSLDVILVGILGTPQEVNQLALITGVFSIPSVAMGFVAGKLQIRWSRRSIDFVREDMKYIILLSLGCSLLLVPICSMLIAVAGIQAAAANQAGIILSAGLLSLLSNIGIAIGTFMNSRLMFARQVAVAGLLALPLNIILSVYLYHLVGVIGVIAGTIVAQAITITGNTACSSLLVGSPTDGTYIMRSK